MSRARALYRFGFVGLQATATKIVVGTGCTSWAKLPHQCGNALASRLGTQVVEFPGGHAGFITHPRAFAMKLREVFEANEHA
jgi:hypothetical protein